VNIASPVPRSYHKCFEYDKQLIVVLGITDDLGNPSGMNMFNFETKIWTYASVSIKSRSRVVAD